MELRKLQLTGGSSVSVTLPKEWVDRQRVKPGDLVACTEQPDGSLSVLPQEKAKRASERYVVEIGEGDREYTFRKVIAAYLMGYDSITVKGKRALGASARSDVRQAVRRIIGLEIVEEDAISITLQDFLDPREFHMDKALRRMTLLAHAMQEESLASIRAPSPEACASIAERDDEVDRLYWLMNKQYHAMLRDSSYAARMELTPSQALNFLLAARLVERTADHALRIANETVALPKGRVPEALLNRLEKDARKAIELFRAAVGTFFKPDAKRANEIVDEATAFAKSHERTLKEVAALSSGETVSHLAILIESIGRTAAYAADVGEIAINHKVATSRDAA